MIKIIAAAAAFAALAVSAASAKDCSGIAGTNWPAIKGYSIGAIAGGPDCQKAVALIVIRDADGNPVYHESYVAEYVMVLAGAQNSDELTKALKDWISTSDQQFKTTADLPEWKAGEDQPMLGEFAFYPEEGMDRDTYEKIRAAKTPAFSYVQGMESIAVITVDPEAGVVAIGAQSFPG
ncbi:MAG: hypothetical protein QM698_16595 [Micropepsaceae bacterium]